METYFMLMDRKSYVLSNSIYRFGAIPIKILVSYFVEVNKLMLKFIWEDKRSRIATTILKENNKVGRLTLYMTYYKATVIKMAWYW